MRDIEYLESLYCSHAGLEPGSNLYIGYSYDKTKCDWNVAGFAKHLGIHPRIASAMFAMMDTDNNGTLDFFEFAVGYGCVTRGTVTARLNLLFRIFDADGNDSLDLAEVKAMLRCVLKSFHYAAKTATGPGGAGIAQAGKLCKARRELETVDAAALEEQFEKEVIRVSESLYKVCDKNGDGVISRDEFKSSIESNGCPEIKQVLALFDGGSISQWNALGAFIEVNGVLPLEQDFKVSELLAPLPPPPAAAAAGPPGSPMDGMMAIFSPRKSTTSNAAASPASPTGNAPPAPPKKGEKPCGVQ